MDECKPLLNGAGVGLDEREGAGGHVHRPRRRGSVPGPGEYIFPRHRESEWGGINTPRQRESAPSYGGGVNVHKLAAMPGAEGAGARARRGIMSHTSASYPGSGTHVTPPSLVGSILGRKGRKDGEGEGGEEAGAGSGGGGGGRDSHSSTSQLNLSRF